MRLRLVLDTPYFRRRREDKVSIPLCGYETPCQMDGTRWPWDSPHRTTNRIYLRRSRNSETQVSSSLAMIMFARYLTNANHKPDLGIQNRMGPQPQ
jgi:hypothetical protein